MTARFGRLLILGTSLGVGLVAAALAGSPSPSPAVSQSSCVFDSRYTFSSEPCAPFTRIGIKIERAIPATAFGADTPPSEIAALDDGSVMVQTDRSGLYRIVDGGLKPLWRPNPRCASSDQFSFSLAQAFDNKLLVSISGGRQVAHESLFSPYQDGSAIVRSDGSLVFRSPLVFESVAQDSSGVTWLLQGQAPKQTLYALLPNQRDLETVPFSEDIYRLFRSPNGHVYVTNFSGLYQLVTRPSVRARLVHAPIQPVKPPGHESDAQTWPIQAVGADRSLWASTPTQVIHVHPNGTMRVMLLMRPPNAMRHPLPIISLTMTRDGAVWNTWGDLVRIDNDDRIEVINIPKTGEVDTVKFGSESHMWVLVHDAETHQVRGVVNFVPAVTVHGAITWPFKSVGSTPKQAPVLHAPCPPPSTPMPPLPPQSGPVNFVYVANAMSRDVWGYWTDAKGNLTPVRGSPFAVAGVTFTIDASGRHLYVGTWYDGIFAYTIDARSGTLRSIVGSPFKAPAGPSTVVIDHTGRYAYSADLNGKSFSGYATDRINGALHSLPWSPFALDRWPFRLTTNPQRNLAYFVTNRGIEMFEANGDVPKPTLIIPLRSFGGTGILIDRRARWAYFASDDGTISIYGIDRRSGALMPPMSPPVKGGNDPRAMAIDPSGRFLYVTTIPKTGNGPTILGFRIDSQSGALRELPTSPFSGAASGNGVTITPDGAFLYATNFSGKTIAGFAIDQRTGALWRLPHSPFKAGDTPDQIVSCRRIGDSCKPMP